jgi:dTDP-glucose pyrophosphorylase
VSYRVLIPTAGIGSRLKSLTQYLNKSLVSIANRPTICHVIEQFPNDCEFVIALGYKGDLVRDFLEMAYPNRNFLFESVSQYEGVGSGLGLSILACEKHLSEPFVFISCDTLVKGNIPIPDHNWMGSAEVDNLSQYRTLKISNNQVLNICEKGELEENLKAYIGLAGIYSYQDFWKSMNEGVDAILQGESYAMRSLLDVFHMSSYVFDWYDTGNLETLSKARKVYSDPGEPNILEKENEAIWFVGKRVIKFSEDKKFISNRVKRAEKLKGFVPQIFQSKSNMYSYEMVSGDVLSNVVNKEIFESFLSYSQNFWTKSTLDGKERSKFKDKCLSFYKNKTYERIELFYSNFKKSDNVTRVNGVNCPPLGQLLDCIDWNWICDGIPGRFHGDFHFENILWSGNEKKFTFLDWRQDFAGDINIGDIYYDFAKLMHGLIVNHGVIARNQYEASWINSEINFELIIKDELIECQEIFLNWLSLNGYDQKKVKVMTALIYLNIAALHHHPYSILLYGLGKEMLTKEYK